MSDKRILIIEDEIDSINYIKRILENQGLSDIITAKDGEEGLAKARNEKPDLIILDIQLPKINGFEVYNILCREQATKNIPVVILTALSERIGIKVDKKGVKEYFGKEPDAYIDKPFMPEQLADVTKKLLKIF